MRLFKRTSVDFEKEVESKSSSKIINSVKGYLNPSLLSREFLSRQIPFFIFLAVLGIIYIGNQYHAEKITNELEALRKQRSEKRAEFISSASDLMRVTRQSQVLKLVEEQGLNLKPLNKPPVKIIIGKK